VQTAEPISGYNTPFRTLRLCLLLLATAFTCRAQFDLGYAQASEESSRSWLLGDWGGLRTRLSERGVDFYLQSVTDAMGVVHGGLANQPAGWTRVRGTIDVNIDRLTGKSHGLSFHAAAMWQTGKSIANVLGSYANPSSNMGPHVFRMDSFWLQKQFADGLVLVRLGQMGGWDFFGNQQYGADYLILPLGYSFGNIFSNTYMTFAPAGVPAAYVRAGSFHSNTGRPGRGVYLQSGIFSGNRNPLQQDTTGLHFLIVDSPVVASEAGYVWDVPTAPNQALPQSRKIYPGIYRFGGIINPGAPFTNQLTGVQSRGGYLYYFMASQAVYRAEAGSNRGLDFTFGYDNSPNDINQENSTITGGAIYHGIIPHRRADDLALGFVSIRNGNAYSQANQLLFGFPLGWEKAYTIDYRAQIKRWLVVQPTLQSFHALEGNPHRPSGLVIGLRVDVSL
jgi:porin